MTNFASDDDTPDTGAEFSTQNIFFHDTLSPETIVLIRKNEAVFLQKYEEIGGRALAERLGVHETAMSRYKTKGALAFAVRVLAALGLKIVPANAIVFIRPDEYN